MSLCCDVAPDDTWKDYGDYILEKLEIKTRTGESLDVKRMIDELNVYEDIFSTFVSGNITLSDASGIMEEKLVNDLDEIFIEIRTPGSEDTLKYDRIIYKIEPSTPEGQNIDKEQFIIHFTALEQLVDVVQKISKTFKGKHHEIAQGVFDEYLTKTGREIVTLEPAQQEIRYTAPTVSPMQVIMFMTAGAYTDKNDSPSFVFYEDMDGYHFRSIEKLKDEPVKLELDYDATLTHKFELEKKKHKVLSLVSEYRNDALHDLTYGKYGKETLSDLSLFNHTEIVKFEEDPSIRDQKEPKKPTEIIAKAAENSLSTLDYRPVNTWLYEEGEVAHGGTFLYWHGERKSYFMDLIKTRVVVVFSGDTRIRVGNRIKLNTVTRIKDKDKLDDTTDKQLSGEFIVTACSHNVSRAGHYTALELMRHGKEIG